MKTKALLKNSFRIGEISRLYGISSDTLRYYERLGLLSPSREDNGYRAYSLKDMNSLTLIRDMRALDVPMDRIAARMGQQTIDNTQEVLSIIDQRLSQEVKRIRQHRAALRRNLNRLEYAASLEDRSFQRQRFAARPCIRVAQYITKDEEIDFFLRELQHKEEENILTLASQTIGASFSMEEILAGTPNVYTSVFFILEENDLESYDFFLPAGEYLSYFYRGDYPQHTTRLKELLRYGKREGLHLDDHIFEVYWVDNRDTLRPEEFVTEIRVQILP